MYISEFYKKANFREHVMVWGLAAVLQANEDLRVDANNSSRCLNFS